MLMGRRRLVFSLFTSWISVDSCGRFRRLPSRSSRSQDSTSTSKRTFTTTKSFGNHPRPRLLEGSSAAGNNSVPLLTFPKSPFLSCLRHKQSLGRVPYCKMSTSETDEERGEGASASSGGFTVSEVLIELNDELKGKLVSDLASICDVDANTARFTLEAHKWNMQACIDFLLDQNNSDEEGNDDDEDDEREPTRPSPAKRQKEDVKLEDVCSPGGEGQKEKESELERKGKDGMSSGSFSTWAPEKFSILSWNLDGLDDKNLEKRTEYVVSVIEKHMYDIIFLQELLPFTFDYIARRLLPHYKPVIGTENPYCDYMTATFLRKHSVYYEEHYIVPYPNTVMQRNLLVTKAFIGQAKLALLNTHLESTAEFSDARKVQLKTCFDLSKSFDPQYNVIFGGDLNLRDKEVSNLLPSEMCDLWVQCGSRPTCQYTWDLTRNTNKQMPSKYQPRCRFDRLYFRSALPPNLNPEFFGVTGIEKVPGTQSFPSDHWAIISFFAISKEARKPAQKAKDCKCL